MTPTRFVLHAGFHKTGTTSAQAALLAHQAALTNAGWTVQVNRGNPRLASAAQAAREYARVPDPAGQVALAAALAQWVEGLSSGGNYLVSSEDFVGRMPGHGVSSYGAAPAIAAALAAALEARFGQGLDLRFLYTTRSGAEWLASIHWQLSKHHRMKISAEGFARRHADAADLRAVVQAVRTVLGWPVAEVALEDLAQRPLGPVEALYDLAELPDAVRAGLSVLPAANARGLVDLAEVFVALNRTEMPPALRDAMKAALRGLANPG